MNEEAKVPDSGKLRREKKVKNLKITVDAVELADQEKDVDIGYMEPNSSPVEDIELFDELKDDPALKPPENKESLKKSDKPVVFHVTVKTDINKDLDEIYNEKFLQNDEEIADDFDEPFIPLPRNLEGNMDFDNEEPDTAENKAKRVARAKRFGIEGTEEDFSSLDERIRSLYTGFGIPDPDKLERSRVWEVEKNRYDTIHVHGVDEMSSSDLFRYFGEFPPERIEWINDQSCNVWFKDRRSAGKTMLLMTQPMRKINESKKKTEEGEVVELEDDQVADISDAEDSDDGISPMKRLRPDAGGSGVAEENNETEKKDEDVSMVEIDAPQGSILPSNAEEEPAAGSVESVEVTDVTLEENNNDNDGFTDTEQYVEVDLAVHQVPPGKWRVSIRQTPRAELLLMRFATISDRKAQGSARQSQIFNDPVSGGIAGIVSGSSRKRRHGRHEEFQEDDYEGDFGGSRSIPFGDLRSRLYNRRKYEGGPSRKPYNDLDTVIDPDGNEVLDEDVDLEEWTEHDDRDLTYYDEVVAARNRLRQQKEREDMPPPGVSKKSKLPAMRMRADEEEKSRTKRREQRLLLGLSNSEVERDSRLDPEYNIDWPPRLSQSEMSGRQRRYSQSGSGNVRDRLGRIHPEDEIADELEFEDETDYLEDYDDFVSDYRSRREDREGDRRRRRSRSFSSTSVETFPRGGTAGKPSGLRGAEREKGRWRPPTDITRMKVTVENS